MQLWSKQALQQSPPPPIHPSQEVTHLQVVIVAAQVRGDAIFLQQRPQSLQKTGSGAVMADGPNRIVTGHQHVV